MSKKRKQTCNWNQDDFESDTWATDCGKLFQINDGPPSENGMKFCCYCGKPLTESVHEHDA